MKKRTLVSSSILGVGVIIATLFFLSNNLNNAEQSGESDKNQASASTSSSEKAATSSSEKAATMDPGMSGMDHDETATEGGHSETATEGAHDETAKDGGHGETATEGAHSETATEGDHTETATEGDHGKEPLAQRPLKATLGVFGFGTFVTLIGAMVLRRKDRKLAAAKKAARVGISAKK